MRVRVARVRGGCFLPIFVSKSLGAGKRGHRLVTMPVIQPGRGRLSLEDFISGRSSLCVRVRVSRVACARDLDPDPSGERSTQRERGQGVHAF